MITSTRPTSREGEGTASFMARAPAARRVQARIEANDDPQLVVTLDPERSFTPMPGELERRFALDTARHWRSVDDAGRPVGVVSAVVWPRDEGEASLAWLYGMVVAPRARRKGIGRALLRHALDALRVQGVGTVALDATDEGRALYAAEGFRTVGETRRWRRPPGEPPVAPRAEKRYSLYPISACEVMELWAYDKPRFGANRVPWLASTMARFPERAFVAFDRKTGAIAGYVESQERWIGPLVAEDDGAARWLLYAAERAGAPAAAITSSTNPAAERMVRAAGYEHDGIVCTRMVRGGDLPGRLEAQWLVASWALG